MARDSAEVRGHAKVRPFRVAQLVDVTSPDAIRDAIANLTVAWGGFYTPIIDANQPCDDIELQARVFDVDALHLEAEEGELLDQLRRAGWLWRGRGQFGPFAAAEEGFRAGVLPASALALDHPPLLLPEWSPDDPLGMFYTALFGTPTNEIAASDTGQGSWEPEGSQRVGLGAVSVLPDVTVDNVGMIQTTKVGLSPEVRHDLDWINGLFVIRPGNMQDLVTFWNLRAFGRPVVALPAEGPEGLLSLLTRGTVPGGRSQYGGPNGRVEKYLGVWGLENASELTRKAIDAMAERLKMVVRDHHPFAERRFVFPGLDSRFKASVRAEFPSNARSVMVRVPSVPLVPDVHQVMPGTVAVEIDVHEVPGLDPRSTAGLTLQQLRAEVKKHHGAWPDKLTSFRTSVDDYAEYTVNNLLFSGLFVPMLDVHCSNCRVDSQVSPRDLDSSVQCEFCGETFRLALSLALSRSKSRWRYRLASHLGPEKVKALLPALATSSLLGQLTTRSGATGTHAFGVEFNFAGNRRVEADIQRLQDEVC
jgi:hypothetical protein